MRLEVRESQIEDVLVNASALTRRLLDLKDEPRLLGRQIIVPSGRLDLLYAYRTKLLLVELKVVECTKQFFEQILNYKNDLFCFQQSGKLLKGEIEPHLLCTDMTASHQELADKNGVKLTKYDPREILSYFYTHFKPIAHFAEIKPIDIGIWNIHLIHELIYFLDQTQSVSKLHELIGGSEKTLYNKIRFASDLRLVDWKPNRDHISLSDFGKNYSKLKDSIIPIRVSEKQAELLRTFVMKNPYESPIILGIASVVESVYALAKNSYPVSMNILTEFFAGYAGKHFDWKTPKAKYNATRMYTNYSVDLGLIAKTEDSIFLTPEGFRFTVMMQMHKNLRMVESLNVT